jgi:hypothetical protein
MNNGLSDHDAQLLIIKTISFQVCKYKISTRRIVSDQSLLNFKMQLSFETWHDVFSGNDADTIFNCFFKYIFENFQFQLPIKENNYSQVKN